MSNTKALSKQVISLKDGGTALHAFLKRYHAQHFPDSSTEKGHVYWSAPTVQWMLVQRKGPNAIVTFHDKDNCPCKML